MPEPPMPEPPMPEPTMPEPTMPEPPAELEVSTTVTTVIRLWLPDRPGALGQVASRIGAVRGDVLAIEILEQGAGRAIDELVVELPDRALLGLLATEIGAVDGVAVEDMRIVEADRVDPTLSTLAVGAQLAEAPHVARLDILISGVQRVLDAQWVAAIRERRLAAGVGDLPDESWLMAFIDGSGHLDAVDDTSPSDLYWAHLAESGYVVVAGRSHRPIHERERVRMSLLLRLADALVC
jgi:hypothetical protein